MFNKAVDTYPYVIQFVDDCYKFQKTYDKAVDTCYFIFDSAPHSKNRVDLW